MPWRGPAFPGDFPSLGWGIVELWAELLPSPRDESAPLVLTEEQVWEIVDWYAIDPDSGRFVFRRGMARKAKGTGKSPLEAAKCITELALPCVFDGWDADGEPVARPWGTGGLPAPWVQIASLSEDQDENTYAPLHFFLTANDGAAADDLGIDVGVDACYLAGTRGAKIEKVTSRAGSREGQPVVYGLLDESGQMTPENGGVKLATTIARNLTKMNGRRFETTNGYAPGVGSVAERTDKAHQRGTAGIYVVAPEAPREIEGVEVNLDAPDRILRAALGVPYRGCWWTDLDRVVADVRDPDTPWSESARFFFNWNERDHGRAVDPGRWEENADRDRVVEPGERIGLGFDGSISNDSTSLVACTADGFSWPIRLWERARLPNGNPDPHWRVPRSEVHDTIAHVFATFSVGLFLVDPPKWWSELEGWQELYGETVVLPLDTYSTAQFAPVVDRWRTGIREGTHTHNGDPALTRHVLAATLRRVRGDDDEDGRARYVIEKPEDGRKIDGAVADALAFAAASTMPEEAPPAQPIAVWV